MAIAKITGPGLTAIAACVAMLWGCVVSEHALVQRAVTERIRIVREIQQLQRHQQPEPVSLPGMRGSRTPRVTAG
jgi:hypothetical protein